MGSGTITAWAGTAPVGTSAVSSRPVAASGDSDKVSLGWAGGGRRQYGTGCHQKENSCISMVAEAEAAG